MTQLGQNRIPDEPHVQWLGNAQVNFEPLKDGLEVDPADLVTIKGEKYILTVPDVQSEVLSALALVLKDRRDIVLFALIDNRNSSSHLLDPSRREDVIEGYRATKSTLQRPLPLAFFHKNIRDAYRSFLNEIGRSERDLLILSENAAKKEGVRWVNDSLHGMDRNLAYSNGIVVPHASGGWLVTTCKGLYAVTTRVIATCYPDMDYIGAHFGVRMRRCGLEYNRVVASNVAGGIQFALMHLGVTQEVNIVLSQRTEVTLNGGSGETNATDCDDDGSSCGVASAC